MINSFQFSCRLSLQTKTQLYSQPVKGDGIEIPILSEISERHEQPKDTCFCNCHAMLLSYQFVKYINSISPFMRSYFKFREVPYNLRRIQFISFHRQGLQFMALTLCIFLGPSFGIITSQFSKNLAGQYLNKNVIKKIGNIDCGCIIFRR